MCIRAFAVSGCEYPNGWSIWFSTVASEEVQLQIDVPTEVMYSNIIETPVLEFNSIIGIEEYVVIILLSTANLKYRERCG